MIEDLRMMVGPSTEEAQRTMSKQGDGRSGKGAEGVGRTKEMAFRWSQYVKYFPRNHFHCDGFRTQFWIEDCPGCLNEAALGRRFNTG